MAVIRQIHSSPTTMNMRNTIRAVQKAVKAGIKAASEPFRPTQYQVGSTRVVCSQCNNDQFELGGSLSLPLLIHALQCSKCSHIELFANEPQNVKSADRPHAK